MRKILKNKQKLISKSALDVGFYGFHKSSVALRLDFLNIWFINFIA